MSDSRFEQLIEGLMLLNKLRRPDDDRFDFQHDEGFFPGPPPNEISPEDATTLARCGFRWDRGFECWAKFS